MRTTRHNTFETNSSSTHSVTVLSDEDYNKVAGEDDLWYSEKYGIKKQEEVIELIKKNFPGLSESELHDDWRYYAKDLGFMKPWDEDSELEQDTHKFKTKSGETYVVCCTYGYDG